MFVTEKEENQGRIFHFIVGGGNNKHKNVLRAIPEGDTKSTVATVNNILNVEETLITTTVFPVEHL